ncbi:MAG: hypothetical protein WC501_01950 [Candidatus Micrarchaeia archaeon]
MTDMAQLHRKEQIAVLIRKKITQENILTPSTIAKWITYRGVDITDRIITTQIRKCDFEPKVYELSSKRDLKGADNSQAALISINDPIALGYLVTNIEMIRAKFKTLIIGGQIPSLIPQKISKMFPYANIFVGECEGSILRIINDAIDGKTGQIYTAPIVDLKNEYIIPDATYKPSGIMYSAELGRGCTHGCSFCGMPPSSKKVRIRNPEQVIEELDRVGTRILFVDPNISLYPPEYLEKIFGYLEKKGKFWTGEGSSKELIENPGIWDLMSRTCIGFLTGYEDPKLVELRGKKNGFGVLEQMNGAFVLNSAIIGHPKQDENSLLEMAKVFRENNLTGVFHMYAPYPGTRDFETLKKSGSILENNFFRYNRHDVVVNTEMGIKKTREIFRTVNRTAQTITGTLKEILRMIKNSSSFKLAFIRIASVIGIRFRNYMMGYKIKYTKEEIIVPIEID